MQFPKDFLWGTATSAHQTEGHNSNSDWWAWEKRDRTSEPEEKSKYPLQWSNHACDSYNRFEEDFDLCVKLNNNAVRLGIEWARIEPEQGKFDQKEIEHYKKVLRAAKDRGLQTFVTLHHFSSPKWISWTKRKTPKHFANFAEKCAEKFGELIDVYLTINEPQVYAMQSYLRGIWPPQKRNPWLSLVSQLNFIRAHNKAYKAIKKVGDHKVGIVKNLVWFRVSKDSKIKPIDWLATKVLQWLSGKFFLGKISRHSDLIGVNYYFTNETKNLKHKDPQDKISDMGWWLHPSGMEKVLLRLKKYKLPVYITENGLADAEDKQREWWIKEILEHCHNAMEQGVDLRGYFHWSLIDNYEWAEGFWPRFGLVEIDRENNLERKPRPSFYTYAQICKTGKLEP
ncbi:glycoside hydrolase family 1 protein [Patescibacteria group bacterium]